MSEPGPPEARSPLTGLKVLIVEDETMVALQVEDMLKALGCAAVWHASGVDEALSLLREHRPDAAVLNVYLAGDLAYPIARWLDAERIPFIFVKGYGRRRIVGDWASRPTIQKPITIKALRAKLMLALDQRA